MKFRFNSIQAKILFTLAVVCLSMNFTNAQSKEGHIKYSVEVSSDNPDMAMVVSMMEGAKMEVAFKGMRSFVKMDMGTMMNIRTITNKDGDILMLMGGMMGNKAIKTSIKEMENDSDKVDDDNFKIVLKKDTKMIAGYKCKKALITGDDDNEIVYWYTDEFVVEGKTQGNANGRLPGIALAFEMENENGLTMNYTATEVKTKVKDDSIFSLDIPEGFTEMKYDDYKNMGM